MKKVLSVAMVALFVAGSTTFAGEACCGKKEAKKECSKEKSECTKEKKECTKKQTACAKDKQCTKDKEAEAA